MFPLLISLTSAALAAAPQHACPKAVGTSAIFGDARIEWRPGLTCFEESHPDARAQVFFTVEHSVRRDPWGMYPRMVRQLIVSWVEADGIWEVQFVTDPKADGRGITLFKRDGVEVLAVRKRNGPTEATNRYLWFHVDSGFVTPEDGNAWADPRDRQVRRIVRRLRRVGYKAHRELEPWIVDRRPRKAPPRNPRVLDPEQVEWLAERVAALEDSHAG